MPGIRITEARSRATPDLQAAGRSRCAISAGAGQRVRGICRRVLRDIERDYRVENYRDRDETREIRDRDRDELESSSSRDTRDY